MLEDINNIDNKFFRFQRNVDIYGGQEIDFEIKTNGLLALVVIAIILF